MYLVAHRRVRRVDDKIIELASPQWSVVVGLMPCHGVEEVNMPTHGELILLAGVDGCWFDAVMVRDVVRPRKPRPGDQVAVLSPSFAAPGVAPAVHEQAMRRLTELT
ncbi:MAG TPA: hypothetical protein VGG05_24950 [Pseudonocardiaceae bacterium]